MYENRQAINNISESQLLTFLRNRLTDAFAIELVANAELGLEDILEVQAGVCADGI